MVVNHLRKYGRARRPDLALLEAFTDRNARQSSLAFRSVCWIIMWFAAPPFFNRCQPLTKQLAPADGTAGAVFSLLSPPFQPQPAQRARALKCPPQFRGGLQWFDLPRFLSYNVIPASAGVRSGAFPAAVSTSYSKGGDFYEYRATFTYAGVFAPRLSFLDFRF